MSRNYVPAVLLGVVLAWSSISLAEPLAKMQKVGQAKLQIWFWDIYQSSLYSLDGQYIEQQLPLGLKIHYLRDIKANELLHKTADEWQKLGLKSAQTQTWLDRLELIWPDLQKGDELLVIVDQDSSSTFFYNQRLLDNIQDPEFGPSFLRIWLDKNSSFPKLRQQLIGEVK